jgi:UDP-N-acetyl-D-glucosamine dehydrogenase
MNIENQNPEIKVLGVIGLGYVGLPLCVVFANAGYKVYGFDINNEVCNNLNNGISHINDVSSKELSSVISNNLFVASTNFELLNECDAISICVPTPLNKIKDPDLSYVISATKMVKNTLRKNQLIILESTTYPGTTKDLILPILNESGFKVGQDFFLCFSPERVDPGNKTWNTQNTPKIIGGITDKCNKIGIEFYSKIFNKIINVNNTEAAELVKVYENTFRMVNIALANELSLICDKLNLDVWSIIDAAATKPFGFMKFSPGPGLGGHCIPLDPHYLSWKMRMMSFKTRLIDLASEINSEMPISVVDKVIKKLNSFNKPLNDSKIMLIGVAYKKDIDDIRESPALEIIKLLQEGGANVSYHDPYVKIVDANSHVNIPKLPLRNTPLNLETISEIDICLIITDHSNIDYKIIYNNCNFIDTRGVMKFNQENQ